MMVLKYDFNLGRSHRGKNTHSYVTWVGRTISRLHTLGVEIPGEKIAFGMLCTHLDLAALEQCLIKLKETSGFSFRSR